MQQTLSNTTSRPTAHNLANLLRNTLLANGVFSTLCGLLFMFDSSAVSNFLGLDTPTMILILGIGLLLFAGTLFWLATRPKIDRRWVQIIAVLDVAWVVGSIIILTTGVPALSSGGWWAVAIVADIVAVFAILEIVGLRQMAEAAKTGAISPVLSER